MLDQGIMENQQIVNWGKTFMASTMFAQGEQTAAITIFQQVLDDYIKTLDGDDLHPFLELYYSQIGSMTFQLKDYVSAEEALEKLVAVKKRMHGPKSKHVIGPLMKLQHISSIVLSSEE